jgi:hypothetical protein
MALEEANAAPIVIKQKKQMKEMTIKLPKCTSHKQLKPLP